MSTNTKLSLSLATFVSLVCMASVPAQAAVITGTISNWQESSSVLQIGSATNKVSIWWSVNDFNKGFFYARPFSGSTSSSVAFATGVTDISQITDASIFSFTSGSRGPLCDADCDPDGVGDFVVWRNINTGHYAVLRIDDINVIDLFSTNAELSGTWWFQTDGTGNFSSLSSAVPEPLTIFGAATAAGFGALFKRELNKKQKQTRKNIV